MNRFFTLFAFILAISFVSGCADSSNKDINVSDGQTEHKGIASNRALTEEDFNVSYNGIEIGESIPFEELAEQLGVSLGDADSNTDPRAILTMDGDSYGWYTLHYPDREKTEMEIDYVFNETKKTAWIVWVCLFSGDTKRGLAIGDSLEKCLELYGEKLFGPTTSFKTTEYYHYKLNEAIEDKEIHVEVDKSSQMVNAIFLDYCSQQSMRELDTIIGD